MVIKRPEAAAVYLPKPSTARLKMPPHITDVQRPQSTINRHFTGTPDVMMKPSETLYAGMLIVRSPGKKMVISSSAIAVVVTKSICERVDTFPLMIELEKRPTSISIQ